MLKIYLVSVLPVQPLSFSFNTSAFQFQHLQRLSFLFQPFSASPFFFFFSFLVQRLFLFFPFFYVHCFGAPFFFFFQFMCCPFFQPKNISQPKTFFHPKTFLFCYFTSLYLSKSSFSSNLK